MLFIDFIFTNEFKKSWGLGLTRGKRSGIISIQKSGGIVSVG